MEEEFVILVDEQDNEIGLMQKNEAHKKALLHRAISIFVYNTNGDLLLQRRAFDKYHSAGLWTNSCCTHPLPNESNLNAANRRLEQEMGIQCTLIELFTFTYKEILDSELSEHEFDHVFIGITDDMPIINSNEVSEFKYLNYNDINIEILKNPTQFTVWFKKIIERVNGYKENLIRIDYKIALK